MIMACNRQLLCSVLIASLSALCYGAVPDMKGWARIKLNLSAGRDGYLYVPPTYTASKPSPLLVMLHGARKGAQDALEAFSQQDIALMAQQRALLLVPESRGQTWDVIQTGSYGSDLQYLKAALATVLSRYNIDRQRMALAGFSDGATYALSLGTGGRLFSHVMAYSPGGYIPPATVGPARVFIAHGRQDNIFPIDPTSRQIVPMLRQQAPRNEVQYVEFNGAHQVVPAVSKQALEWFLLGRRPVAGTAAISTRGR